MANIITKKEISFLVGSDCEFCCANSRGIINANGTMYDTSGPFGADGCGRIFEVRPAPAFEPTEIIGNIYNIFTKHIHSNLKFLNYEWKAGSYKHFESLGGHIHFGTGHKISRTIACEYLDNYVGAISLLIEDKREGQSRRNDGYGRKGDTREQPYGFEYRVLSSWLSSPYVSLAILSLAKTVLFEVLNNRSFPFNTYVTEYNFNYMHTQTIKSNFKKIWRDITKMRLYQKYKIYIDVLYFLVKNDLNWFPASGMKEAWGIVNKSQFNCNKIQFDTIWWKYKNSLKQQTI